MILEMLRYCRPAGSQTEDAFRQRFLLSLPGAYTDQFGNIHVQVGPEPSRVLFSSHTDTVHRGEGLQTLQSKGDIVSVSKRSQRISNCLGADDTAGVYLMREMILARIPGRYVFHWAEERGGQGSRDLALAHGAWLAQFDYAVAFDRRGMSDVITHQAAGRCCSDVFAVALADALNGAEASFRYRPSDAGIFTDTANYVEYVAECTNISVGYDGEHGLAERLDVGHLFRLRDALLRIDWTALPVGRRPGEDDPDDWHLDYLHASDNDRFVFNDDDDDDDDSDPYVYLDPVWQRVQDELRRQLKTKGKL